MSELRLLDALDDETRRQVIQVMRRRKFTRREVLFHEGDTGDSLHLVAKGHVAIVVTTPLGDAAMLTVLRPGDAFGEQSLLTEDSRRTATARAIDQVETQVLHRDDFRALRRAHPEVEQFLTEALAAQVRRLTAHLVDAMYLPADQRVLRRLTERCATFGAGGGSAVVPLTQEDLAATAGTTRPTVNRVLKAAESDGLLVVARGRIEIHDVDELARRSR